MVGIGSGFTGRMTFGQRPLPWRVVAEHIAPRQRLGLVTMLLLVYAAVALMILFGGMRSRETSIPAVEHLRQPLLPERSLLPLNTSEDDTQER